MTVADPLALDIGHQSAALNAHLGHQLITTLEPRVDFLNQLSRLLATPAYTLVVAKFFRPLLVDLTCRWLYDDSVAEELRFVALALLIETHEEIFPVLLDFLQRPSLAHGPLAFATPENAASLDAAILQPILLAYHRLLAASPFLPAELNWPLHPLLHIVRGRHPHRGVMLLAIRCYALQANMPELARENMIRKYLGELADEDCTVHYGVDQNGQDVFTDGWLLPVTETSRVGDDRTDIANTSFPFANEQTILPELLCPRVENVENILLLKDSTLPPSASTLVMTPHLRPALQKLAVQYSLRFPTLLTSVPSAGKTVLLSHLASRLHPGTQSQAVVIHLADTSIDARSLLGSHVSSQTVPGKFEWKEGVLLRAMREGRWVVLKDIDRASVEVLGVLLPLVDSMMVCKYIGSRAYIDVPNRGRVFAHHAFALFATRSVATSGDAFPAPTFLGAHKFTELVLPTPTQDDLATIVDARCPRIAGPAARALISLWDSIRALGPAAGVRPVGMLELDKWCSRVSSLLPASWAPPPIVGPLTAFFTHPSLREDMFLEARDVFFGTGAVTASAQARNADIARLVATQLELSPERASWLLDAHTPALETEKDAAGITVALRVGRTRLPARVPPAAPAPGPFALHRPALSLLARIASAVALREPVLLTGETGTGKTTLLAHAAARLGRRLVALNLSNQSEAADLVGGFKPVDARVPGGELQEAYTALFARTFSRRRNEKFDEAVAKAVRDAKWKRAVGLWREAGKLARERITTRDREKDGEDAPRKRRKLNDDAHVSLEEWDAFEQSVATFEVQHVLGKSKLAFSFVDGPLLRALRSGDWILLDEINLATPETLECISALLQGPTASITLTEHGSLEPVPRHPDFRLFACMNPATDVGKKDLPLNIRSRFTEIFVAPPDADRETLVAIVQLHIGHLAVGDRAAVLDVAEFYTAAKRLADARQLADGSNQRPHYSMRTLTRMLTFVATAAPAFGLRRAMWEGGLMAFAMALGQQSAEVMTALAEKHLLSGVKNVGALLSQSPAVPSHAPRDDFVQVGQYWLQRGPHEMQAAEEYIVTPSVAKKLVDLARVVYAKHFPVLIEGPTSSGKTSAIEYLAKRTGHRFVRINNHEHTDIQEYIGSYLTDPETGKLTFQDGILVRALRNGDWIVLDELNLAPTDVLEALNRLLDDNRELLIPETLEVVKPHPQFRLFATQNPPGLYAGRKVLSRAFRNRFLEVQFDDVPEAELEEILCRRTRIAPPYAARIVAVFRELQKQRQTSRVFETKHGFATLRDLFRWALRDATSYLELAQNGYMLLAERARRPDDKVIVKDVLESIMKVKLDDSALYGLGGAGSQDVEMRMGITLPSDQKRVVWTSAMQRLFVLIATALRYNEPVLLVGETGCGKTSVCQVFAEATGRILHTVSCHQNTETADIIGGQRPTRNRSSALAALCTQALQLLRDHTLDAPAASDPDTIVKHLERHISNNTVNATLLADLTQLRRDILQSCALFQWHDGPLVEAMRTGGLFLLDEISLADDSVLERLNSVLEPDRTLVLAEMGGRSLDDARVVASEAFKLVATMNPGGDYGKKELSPALRNRFTEIWVPAVDEREDRRLIISNLWQHDALRQCTEPLLDLVDWLALKFGDSSVFGLRDLLAWVSFSNYFCARVGASAAAAFHQAARLTLLDGLDTLPQTSGFSPQAIQALRLSIEEKLAALMPWTDDTSSLSSVVEDNASFCIGPFAIAKGSRPSAASLFDLDAPTTLSNAMRVMRALQVPKPVLLEGSPGVGKTSLIIALSARTGNDLVRINLSDQTDLVDLFGSDLPVQGGQPGEFAWKDAAFLRALQEGGWVLLDEMNLAPQAVLEGLNAVLDHRGEVFIPELSRSFRCHPNFRVFAAQNPQHQGGGRKGLPKSFLNRFTKVHLAELDTRDLFSICLRLYPEVASDTLRRMIEFNGRLHEETMVKRTLARAGAPWEFNLRDILRWTAHVSSPSGLNLSDGPVEHLDTLYLRRFRSDADREQAAALFAEVASMPTSTLAPRNPAYSTAPGFLQVGHTLLHADPSRVYAAARPAVLLQAHLPALQAFTTCVDNGTLTILVGSDSVGKTSLARLLAQQVGRRLHECSLHGSTDTMDILGTFEQVDQTSRLQTLLTNIVGVIDRLAQAEPDAYASLDAELVAAIRSARWTGTSRLTDGTSLQLARRCLAVLKQVPQGSDMLGALERTVRQIETQPSGPTFEWCDGPLVRAVKEGDWLLLDHANLCGASVLDRLNSLCEVNGALLLSECGLVDGQPVTLIPHPNFRLILSVNSRYGELSRAMRNRGLEVCLGSVGAQEDSLRLHGLARVPRLSSPLRLDHDAGTFDVTRRGLNAGRGIPAPQWRGYVHLDSMGSSLSFLRQLLPLTGDTPTNVQANLLAFFGATPLAYQSLHRRQLRELCPAGFNPQDWTGGVGDDATHVFKIIDALLEMRAQTRGVSLLFYRAQPINFTLNPHCVQPQLLEHPLRPDLLIELYFAGREFARRLASVGGAQSKSLLRIALSVNGGKSVASAAIPDSLVRVAALLSGTSAVIASVLQMISSQPTLLQETLLWPVLQCVDLAINLVDTSDRAVFEYSACRLLAHWTHRVACQQPRLAELARVSHELVASMSLTTGQFMTEIWELHLRARSNRTNEVVIAKLAHQARAQRYVERRRNLELMSSLALNIVTTEPSTSFTAPPVEAIYSSTCDGPSPLRAVVFVHLDFLSHAATQAEASHDTARTLLSIVSRQRHSDLLPWVSTQIALWRLDSADVRLGDFLFTWLASDWVELAGERFQGAGPGELLSPYTCQATFDICNWKGRPISQLPEYEENLGLFASLVSALAHGPCAGRAAELLVVILAVLKELLSTLASSREGAVHPGVLKLLASWQRNALLGDLSFGAGRECLLLVSQSQDQTLREVISRVLSPILEEDPHNGWEFSAAVARLWVAVALISLELYFPDIPLDPLAATTCRLQVLEGQQAQLLARLAVARSSEAALTGNTSNPWIASLESRLRQVHDGIAALPPVALTRDTDAFEYQKLHTELRAFMRQVIDLTKLRPLLSELSAGSSAAISRAQSTLATVSAFLDRLGSSFSSYGDIVAPIRRAAMQIMTGIGILIRIASAQGQSPMLGLDALRSSPTVGSICATRKNLEDVVLHGHPADVLVLLISGFAYEKRISIPLDDNVAALDSCLQRICALWVGEREREEQRKKEATSLYRQTHVDRSAEEDDQEFRAMFPDYADVLDESSPSEGVEANRRQDKLIDEQHLSHVYEFHCQLWLDGGDFQSLAYPSLAAAHLQTILRSSTRVDDRLDLTTWAMQLSLLRDAAARSSASPGDRYNFYVDPNVCEVKKAHVLLSTLDERLSSLVDAWPEQMVLRDIQGRCRAVHALDLQSPVAKVLSALELLLLHCDDWERYANRENSLKVEQQSMTSLIVEWRRLELSYWSRLLGAELRSCRAGVADWWFHLYEMVVRGAVAAAEDEEATAADNYVPTVVPLLDSYAITGPVGQFDARLDLIASFAVFLRRLANAKQGSVSHILQRLARVLSTMHAYYVQFLPACRSSIADDRVKIEREITDFIKLASWRDVNVHALKQSAQRTHRQLHKCIRKFRDVLRRPVASVITQSSTHSPRFETPSHGIQYGALPTSLELPSVEVPVSSAAHLANLHTTLRRVSSIVTESVLPSIRRAGFTHVDNLSAEIVATVKSLSSSAIDMSSKGHAKALLQRKHRAWSDMLKELRRAGIPQRLKPSLLENQMRREWLFDQPALLATADPLLSDLATTVDTHFVALVESMTSLRNSLAHHNPDIPTRELERAISVIEATFRFGIDSRARLSETWDQYSTLANAVMRLKRVGATESFAATGPDPRRLCRDWANAYCRLVDSLEELNRGCEDFTACKGDQPSLNPAAINAFVEQIDAARGVRDSLLQLGGDCELTNVVFLSSDELRIIRDAHSHLAGFREGVQHLLDSEPRTRLLCQPVMNWMDILAQELGRPASSEPLPPTQELQEASDSLINAVLVACQQLKKVASTPIHLSSTEEDAPDNFILNGADFLRGIGRSFHLDAILSCVDAALTSLKGSDETAARLVQRVVPFLDYLVCVVHDHLVESAHWTRAVFKLTSVLCTTATTVAKNGWCQPKEADDGAGGDDASGQQAEGTGLGSGSGEKNVSNEIEDESQVEGLQGEDEEEQQSGEKQSGDKDNTIEMSEDFAGALEDVEEDAEKDENEEEEEKEEDDVDDRAEDLDPTDPNAVDEKMWGDDSAEDKKGSDDKTDNAQQSGKDSEMAAKDENRQKKEKKDSPEGGEEEQADDGGDEEKNEPEEEQGPSEEPVGAGGKMDEYTQEGDALDLPDNLDLAPDKEDEGISDTGMEDDELEDDIAGSEIPPDDAAPDGDETQEPSGDQPMQDESEEPTTEGAEDTATAQPDVSAGNDQDVITEASGGGGGMTKQKRDEHSAMDVDGSTEEQQTTDAADPADTQPRSEPRSQEARPKTSQEQQPAGQEGASSTAADEGAPSTAAPLPNPLRHLGNAMKEIQRRLQEILEPTDTSAPDAHQQEAKDVEYLQNEDDAMDMQALGPADGAEKARLEELKFSDAHDQQAADQEVQMMDVDEPEASLPRPAPLDPRTSTTQTGEQEHQDAAIAHHERLALSDELEGDLELNDEQFAVADDKIDADEFAEQSAAVEQALRQWQESGHQGADSENVWRKYESLTHHLSYALCEQLRLILEPTRASRLRGDYRTGKRLNMKKIIPYIASEYTKDKIWLRRTRPSDREYQVLLALDDSRSMSESHSVHLAFETLALVSRALTRLEAGDVAIARFGESVEMLHGFDAGPFTEHAGARVVRDFTFEQKATDVAGLIETSLKVLGEARERRAMGSATAADLWQLQIIISDGMCQAHERLRVLLRRAEEQRIMVVFVVIDALKSGGKGMGRENSIMTMSQVVEKRVGDKVDFEMRRYLDSFPFQYYVVLRDVEALPEVLSGTLKQFFERISEE
ncbi:P-loop containing nucleoside triphosphate hydrolase protein [Auricularia subglabra TFB-10046 SS5]|nr:P-loop containing nucleoside triphosphate hydrolase protein [Auricularia subglabra TFB-10046 SS5]